MSGAAPATDFVFHSLDPAGPGFRVEAAGAPTADEAAFTTCVNGCVDGLARATLRHLDADDPVLLQEAAQTRINGTIRLRAQAEAVASTPPPGRDAAARAAMAQCWRIEGQFAEHIRRLNTTPFRIEPVLRGDDSRAVEDVHFITRDVPISTASGTLKTELDSAIIVTRAVLGERQRAWRSVGWLTGHLPGQDSRQRLHDYMWQLCGIASVGLMSQDPSVTAFARTDLLRYRKEFTVREAGLVKNRYVRRLGWACLIAAVIAVLAYMATRHYADRAAVPYAFRNFFLLAAGTAVGTWLSFSLRRVVLTFDDLAVLEEDRLDPGLRVLFMVGLVSVVGLLFWTGVIRFSIGAYDSQSAMQSHGAWALLVGLLAGIAERALGTAVSRRASDFAVSVGGGAGPSGGPPQPSAAPVR